MYGATSRPRPQEPILEAEVRHVWSLVARVFLPVKSESTKVTAVGFVDGTSPPAETSQNPLSLNA